jgi:hypothetical protein
VERRTERTILTSILVIFAVLGVVYSVVVPPFEASDELWHYPMVKYIADHWALPVQVPGVETPWRQEGSQPPLYYVLAAAATFWIDTSDVEVVRHLNRHVDNGVATADGNINLVVHRPAREAFPWQGTILAIHLIRFLSVSMGVAAVYLTYLIVREVLPSQPGLALGAAAIHAFTPMYVFISGSVNNDNLVVPLSGLALLMLLRLARQRTWTTRQALARYLGLGVVLGLAVLTKTSSLALTVLTALVVTVRAVRRRSQRPELVEGACPELVEGWSEFLMGGLAALLPLLAIAGWWFLRNLQLYGDLSGLNVFTEILGTREIPAGLSQLWRERTSFAAGYWGNFGGLNVPMSSWVYTVLNTLTVVAVLGLVVLLFRWGIGRQKHLVIDRWPLIICVLWGLGVVIPWSQWASTTWSSQGRLIFTALPVWSLLLVLGLAGWLHRRWRQGVTGAFALFLLGLALAAPVIWIKPAYVLPEPLDDAQAVAIPHRVEADFGGTMRLLGYDLETTAVEPGGQVGVTLYWEALAPADRDYTVFVHLLDEEELLVAQRDTFPGLGQLSTTWLEPGFRWADRYVLQVPDTAYTPDTAQIQVGLYDPVTGVRLPATGTGTEEADNVRFGQVQVRARPGDVPNPISVNFGDRMALVGYDLDRRLVRPGETVTLTLHWRCLRRMDVNYNVSAQFIDSGQRKAAQHDGWPLNGAAPTAAWEPGHALTDTYTLTVYPDAPPRVYDVRVVVYALGEEGQIVHLPTVPAGGQMQASHVTLTTMRVAP